LQWVHGCRRRGRDVGGVHARVGPRDLTELHVALRLRRSWRGSGGARRRRAGAPEHRRAKATVDGRRSAGDGTWPRACVRGLASNHACPEPTMLRHVARVWRRVPVLGWRTSLRRAGVRRSGHRRCPAHDRRVRPRRGRTPASPFVVASALWPVPVRTPVYPASRIEYVLRSNIHVTRALRRPVSDVP
jgi:hypothetical protein